MQENKFHNKKADQITPIYRGGLVLEILPGKPDPYRRHRRMEGGRFIEIFWNLKYIESKRSEGKHFGKFLG